MLSAARRLVYRTSNQIASVSPQLSSEAMVSAGGRGAARDVPAACCCAQHVGRLEGRALEHPHWEQTIKGNSKYLFLSCDYIKTPKFSLEN